MIIIIIENGLKDVRGKLSHSYWRDVSIVMTLKEGYQE